MPTENYLKTELTRLIQSEQSTWEFLQEGSLDGVWYWDLEDPEQEWMSPEFWRTFGVDPASKKHLANEWQDIIFHEDLALALENFHAHCADPDHPYDQIVRYRHTDGSTVWIRCRGLAIRDETGKPVRMLGAHTDVTALKRSEQDARAGWRAAEAANDELRSFAYAVSHDLKAPANTLELLLQEFRLACDAPPGDEADEILSMATQTVGRMQVLIEDVLEYTKVIGMEQVFEPVDLTKTAQQAIANLHGAIDARAAQITLGPLPTIMGSPVQMGLLFQNLMSNSLKYCADGITPKIEISQVQNGLSDHQKIVFRDNGIGIAENQQERIFKLFQRLHSADEFEGTGLGLPMCQRIMHNHKGELRLRSQPGEGSDFTLVLPERLQ